MILSRDADVVVIGKKTFLQVKTKKKKGAQLQKTLKKVFGIICYSRFGPDVERDEEQMTRCEIEETRALPFGGIQVLKWGKIVLPT